MTLLLPAWDSEMSRDWYMRVLDVAVNGGFGGTSAVLEVQGSRPPDLGARRT